MTPIRSIAFALVVSLLASRSPAREPETSALDRFARALARQQLGRSFRAMNRPVEPFRVIGNLYFVGASDVSSFLLTTPDGHVLIDSGFEETVPLIRTSIRALGFRFEDVKILLNSHAHIDHAGGHALLKELTGARIFMSEADGALLAAGGKGDFLPLGDGFVSYRGARSDRTLRDKDRVSLGGVRLTARLTPGHTKGCTTWTTTVEDGGKRYDVVFYGSTTLVPGVRVTGNPNYPGMADDFAATFRLLKSLPCDVFLAPHAAMFGRDAKARRLSAGETPNPFIDPAGYRSFVDHSEQVFVQQLRRERASATTPAVVP